MTTKTPISLPNFTEPPLIEVVLGVQFSALTALLAPHFGLFWSEIKNRFDSCREMAPLTSVVENFEKSKALQIEIGDTPPLPRIWFEEKSKNGLLQIQRERFLYNWRKTKEADAYPRFPTVYGTFKEHLEKFESFIERNNLGELKPEQLELTYINHIPIGTGWKNLSDLGAVFPDHPVSVKSFLPEIENINIRASYRMPENVGRLHTSIRNVTRKADGQKIILFELTARGIPHDRSGGGISAWYALAHEWIVRGFSDLTAGSLQTQVWGKK